VYKLVEDRIIVIGRPIGLRQLGKHYGLDVQVEIKVNIVELSSGIANCFAIDL
jgi:hypothetical protein